MIHNPHSNVQFPTKLLLARSRVLFAFIVAAAVILSSLGLPGQTKPASAASASLPEASNTAIEAPLMNVLMLPNAANPVAPFLVNSSQLSKISFYQTQNPPLFMTTLDNAVAVSSPVFGTGVGASIATAPANDFVAGWAGNAVRIDYRKEYVRFQQTDGVTQNIELSQGTLDFWYQPSYDHTDGKKHFLFATGPVGAAPGGIALVKNDAGNWNQLMVYLTDATGKSFLTGVYSTNYSWMANQWVNIRITWDTTGTGQNVHIYLDGVEVPAYSYASSSSITMGAESSSQSIFLGLMNAAATQPANGLIDEVTIYDYVALPSTSDTTPPALSNGQPAGALPSGTTQATLSLNSNEAATCKFDTQPGIPYETMVSTFGTTGGTAHSTGVSGLSDGNTYTYYVRCQDAFGNANGTDFVISFSVATPPPPDTTPPVLSNGQPSGALPSGTTQANLSLSTDENATCKYDTQPGILFASMANSFGTSGGTAHSTGVTGLANGNSYTFYVRCQDTAGNANGTDFPITFSVDTAPSPPTSLPLGNITIISGPTACGTGVCYELQVVCPNVSGKVRVIVQIDEATGPVFKGTVVFNSGSTGGGMWETWGTENPRVLSELRAAGYRTVQLNWKTSWYFPPAGEAAGPLKTACRPATVINWVYNQIHQQNTSAAYCAYGHSNGASAVAYSITQYGLSNITDAALLDAGPNWASLDHGCIQNNPAYQSLWLDNQNRKSVDSSFGFAANGTGPCSTKNPAWQTQFHNASVVNTNSSYVFPNTMVAFVNGDQDPTVVRNQGLYFYDTLVQAGSPLVRLDVVPGAGHYTFGTTQGANTIRDILLTECVAR